MSSSDWLKRMREEWDKRAKENARFYIASHDWRTEEEFRSSGYRDIDNILSSLGNKLTREMRVLEIGCGIGRLLLPLSERFKEVHGIDISEEMISQGAKSLKEKQNVFLHVGNGSDLSPFEDSCFDFVFSYITFHHIPTPIVRAYIKESNRVLRPNGILWFQLYELRKIPLLFHALRYLDYKLAFRAVRGFPDNFWEVKKWPSAKPYTRSEISKMLKDVGFSRIAFASRPHTTYDNSLMITAFK